jgi:hypothetical protein
MGGFGSGRPRGAGRGRVEAHHALDADRLHRAGCLRAGWAGGWQWDDGEQGASVGLRAEPDRLHLSYSVRVGDGEWERLPTPSRSCACRAASAGRGPTSSVPAR